MKHKLTIWALTAWVSCCAFAAPESEQLPLPQQRVTLSIINAMPATNLLGFVAHRSALHLDLADEVQTNAVSLRLKFKNASSAEVISWALRFLDAHATRDGDTLHIRGGNPPALSEGEPLTSSRILAAPFSRTNSWAHRVDQTIEYVLHVAGHENFVMGPDGPILRSEVSLSPNGRSAADIIEDLCAQAGLTCTLHGEVIFIRRKKETGMPNKTNGR